MGELYRQSRLVVEVESFHHLPSVTGQQHLSSTSPYSVRTHPGFHPETRGKSYGIHLQGKFTEISAKPSLKMDNPYLKISLDTFKPNNVQQRHH
ncbi:hypothetical protein ACLB2K_059231 [Fragaria x ananassa]